MVVRTLKNILLLCLALQLCSLSAAACFGPKLYWGVGQDIDSQVLFALTSIYVQEKTGVESIRVDLKDGQDPLLEISEERVDLGFAHAPEEGGRVLLRLEKRPLLFSGPRPLNDLQFTTVVPALNKLAKQLSAEDVSLLRAQVETGEPPLAAARRFLMERRWI